MNKIRYIRSLTAHEVKELKRCLKSSNSGKLRERAQAVWLSHKGYGLPEIAKILDRHLNAVARWFNRFEAHGLAGLKDSNRSGRPPKAGAEFQNLLVKAVKTPPRKLGYPFASWSAERLCDHMVRLTGVRVSTGHLRKLLKKNGIVFRKPKHDLKAKQDPALYNQKKELLEFIKKTWYPIPLALSFFTLMSPIFTSTPT